MDFKIVIVLLFSLVIFGCLTVEKQAERSISEELKEKADLPEVEKTPLSTMIETSGVSDPLIKNIICDEKGLLTIVLINPYSQKFALRNMPLFEAEALGILSTRLTINGRKILELEKLCSKDVLEKGDEILCKIPFNPNDLREKLMVRTQKDELSEVPKNFLRVMAPGFGYEATFICK